LALGVGGKFCVGWVGRLSAEKHPELLLKALDLLRDLPICTAVLGEGRRRRALERRVQRAGLRERVRWCGVVPVAERLFPAFDAFVLSSRTEGTPMVLFEAIAAGVPVIATRVGGVPDLVTRRDALLVEPGDHVALADAIRNVYGDRASAAARARSAHERVEREFSYDAWLARYERLYASVVEIPSGADQVCN
jgi:glycosyltransferase involved in cell wall biosynthesis